jgi:N-acetylglucosamine-6-phosphate deacetylase
VELIADGTHLHPALYRYASQIAGADRAVLVTDAMAAATLGDGAYELGPMHVTVAQGVARIAGGDTIAGSTATMDRLFRSAATGMPDGGGEPGDDQHQVDSDELLLGAVRQASVNPARALGWTDVGSLEPGRRADLVILDADLQVTEVIRRGVSVDLALGPR